MRFHRSRGFRGIRDGASVAILCLVLVLCGWMARTPQAAPGQSADLPPVPLTDLPASSGTIALEFGLLNQEPKQWQGTIAASTGRILSGWGWHFAPPDRIAAGEWSFSTRRIEKPSLRSEEVSYSLLPNGVSVAVDAPDSARFTVRTGEGDYSFTLSELKGAGRRPFFGGDAAAVYLPPVHALTQGDATQHDFPSVVSRGDDIFVAWVAYHNEADAVYLGHQRQGRWTVHRASPTWGNYQGSAAAMDGTGRVHLVWSEYSDDRWRLVSRSLDAAGNKWGAARYVDRSGRRQLFPRMATDSTGRPWVVWQELVNGNFEIRAACGQLEGWSPPIQVSESRANDWAPAIAAAPSGEVWVAWDSYDAGNYDVYLRAIRDGKPEPVVRVTQSESRDANASVAVDPSNRVWLTWEEGGDNWGKDFGVLGKPASSLHEQRHVRLVCYRNGRFTQPVSALETTLPRWLADYQEYPQVAIGPNGVPYVFFSHFLYLRGGRLDAVVQLGSERKGLWPWEEMLEQMFDRWVTGFDGLEWLPVRRIPGSWGRCAVQTGAAVTGNKLFYVWPTDGRSFEDRRLRSSQLRYTLFEFADKPAGVEQMTAFVSRPRGTPDAAPTERHDLARVRAVRWGGEPPLRLYRGELHRHTDISTDGRVDGDILDAYRYAIDAASLDFMAITDHTFHERVNYFKYDWWRGHQIATMFNNPGHFVAFFGYERTVKYPGGHRNVISMRRDLVPFPISDEEFFGVESYAERLYPNLKQHGDIAIAHTTTGNGGTDWRDWDRDAEPLVEIFQGLRGSYEEPSGPAGHRSGRANGFVQNAWARGRRLGVVASSDHISTHQSYACVYAPELTPESIFQGLKQRRTFAATDNIVLKFSAVARDGNEYRMGEGIRVASPPELLVEVQGTGRIGKIELIRNGRIIFSRTPEGAADQFTFRDQDFPSNTAYYYVRVVQEDGMIAWSSPIWVGLSK